jgi:hypothetical protein
MCFSSSCWVTHAVYLILVTWTYCVFFFELLGDPHCVFDITDVDLLCIFLWVAGRPTLRIWYYSVCLSCWSWLLSYTMPKKQKHLLVLHNRGINAVNLQYQDGLSKLRYNFHTESHFGDLCTSVTYSTVLSKIKVSGSTSYNYGNFCAVWYSVTLRMP